MNHSQSLVINANEYCDYNKTRSDGSNECVFDIADRLWSMLSMVFPEYYWVVSVGVKLYGVANQAYASSNYAYYHFNELYFFVMSYKK